MALHNVLGKNGEEEAVRFLERNGYAVLERNWRYNGIEIDIIAQNTDYIIFAEVKTRASSHWGQPEESVNDKKIKRMVAAADYYMQEHEYDLPVRFDVISLIQNGKEYIINHIDDAFWASMD